MTIDAAIRFAEHAQIMAECHAEVQEFFRIAESAIRAQKDQENYPELAPSVDAVHGRWIPVTERMPEPLQPVIVFHENGKGEPVVEIGFKREDHWRTWGSRMKNITHWMPLPEPPEVGMEGGDKV